MEKNIDFKIGIPSKGRLYEGAVTVLKNGGFTYEKTPRHLTTVARSADNQRVLVGFLKSVDILRFVQDGVLDIGIIGEDVVIENEAQRLVKGRLRFGRCAFKVAVPKDSKITIPSQLSGKTIATSYPNATYCYFNKLGIPISVLEMDGSVEASIKLNQADAITDITESGTTAKENQLKPIGTIFKSQAVLISSSNNPAVKQFIQLLRKGGNSSEN